jgi:hypothetical protein
MRACSEREKALRRSWRTKGMRSLTEKQGSGSSRQTEADGDEVDQRPTPGIGVTIARRANSGNGADFFFR